VVFFAALRRVAGDAPPLPLPRGRFCEPEGGGAAAAPAFFRAFASAAARSFSRTASRAAALTR